MSDVFYKICTGCSELKSSAEFARRKESKDGRKAKCRVCVKEARSPESIKTRRKLDCRKRDRRETRKKYRENNKKKIKAQALLNKAVKDGLIVRTPCEICGDIKSNGHHDDYDFPLVVRWLCGVHHTQWHKENGEGLNPYYE